MRIIGGIYKGFHLHTFASKDIRPTPSKVREAVFDIIGPGVIESDFLDLFAGTGAVGIEAFSRGARRVTFVELNKKAILLIKENLIKIHLKDFSNIIRSNYQQAIKEFNLHQRKFDIIFLDPPYDRNYILKPLQEIEQNDIAKNNSIIIVQHQINEKLPNDFKRLICLKKKKYGRSAITIYRFHE
jgi:16S rRNA (guanine966-N2)-methyltransferase